MSMTPAAEGQLLLWIPEGLKRRPHLSPDGAHNSHVNHKGGGVSKLSKTEKDIAQGSIYLCLTCFFLRLPSLRGVCCLAGLSIFP